MPIESTEKTATLPRATVVAPTLAPGSAGGDGGDGGSGGGGGDAPGVVYGGGGNLSTTHSHVGQDSPGVGEWGGGGADSWVWVRAIRY